jgi:hypothetical protein
VEEEQTSVHGTDKRRGRLGRRRHVMAAPPAAAEGHKKPPFFRRAFRSSAAPPPRRRAALTARRATAPPCSQLLAVRALHVRTPTHTRVNCLRVACARSTCCHSPAPAAPPRLTGSTHCRVFAPPCRCPAAPGASCCAHTHAHMTTLKSLRASRVLCASAPPARHADQTHHPPRLLPT